jgi:hypothetical protein
MDLRKIEWDDVGLDCALKGSCEHGNEPSGSIKTEKFLSSCIIGSFSRKAQFHEGVSIKYYKVWLEETAFIPKKEKEQLK